MNVVTVFFHRPQAALSRRRALVGLAGLFSLAVLVIGHAVGLTIFLWEDTVRPSGAVALVLLWVVSAVALFFLARYVRHAAARWPNRATQHRAPL